MTRDIRNAPKWASVKGSCSEIRDGPLEKLWGGGRGIFELQEFFFRYQIPSMNFFQALA